MTSRGLWGAMLLSALVLWGGYSAWFYAGDNYRQALNPQLLAGQAGQVVQGEGRATRDGLIVSAPGHRAIGMAAWRLEEPILIDEIKSIQVKFHQTGAQRDLTVGVSRSASLSNTRDVPAEWLSEYQAEIRGHDLMMPQGMVHFVVLNARGLFDPEMIIDRVELQLTRPNFWTFQGLLLKSLVNLDEWTQRSINHLRPDHRPLRISPVIAVVTWMVITLMLAWVAGWWLRPLSFLGLACFVLAGWLLLDASWQVSLWSRHWQAVVDFGGKSPEQRRLEEIDSDVFEFIQMLKAEMTDSNQRLVIFGDSGFTHFRARYFAVPLPVVSRHSVRPGWLRRLQSGDVVAAVHLPSGLEELDIRDAVDISENDRQARSLQPSEMIGRDAELVLKEGNEWLEFKQDERPWLVQSGWFDLAPGWWRLKVPIGATQRDGWIRLEVFHRDAKDRSDHERLAWREIMVRGAQLQEVQLSFWVRDGREIQFRIRERDARGSVAGSARLMPMTVSSQVVKLSHDGSPPYYLAKKLLETDAGVAYELF